MVERDTVEELAWLTVVKGSGPLISIGDEQERYVEVGSGGGILFLPEKPEEVEIEASIEVKSTQGYYRYKIVKLHGSLFEALYLGIR